MIEKSQWIDSIDGLLDELSDTEFQHRVWVHGEGPEVSSYSELMCGFFDDFSFDSFVEDSWEELHLSESLRSELRHIKSLLTDYNKEDSMDDEQIVNDPKWLEIVEEAKNALRHLRAERSF